MSFRMIAKFKIIFFFLISFLCLIAILLGVELSFRFNLYRTSKYNRLSIINERREAFISKNIEHVFWEMPWDKYKKNIEVKGKNRLDGGEFQVKMNNYGFRTKDIVIPKPKDKYRIVCIGGSTTIEGLTNDTTYPALVEKKLSDYFNSNRIEVLNCGISGFGSIKEQSNISAYLKIQPDLLIEYNAVNDIFWVLMPQYLNNRSIWKRMLTTSLFLTSVFPQYLIVSQKSAEKSFKSYTIANLKAVYEEALKNNVKVVFCSFAAPDISKLNKEEIEYLNFNIITLWKGKINFKTYNKLIQIYNECLEQLCRENNAMFIPVAQYLSGGMDYFRDICHLTQKGIEKKSDIIFWYLKEYIENNKLF